MIFAWGLWKEKEYIFSIFFSALACYTAGALAGFLFGVPRVLQKPSRLGGDVPPEVGRPDTRPTYELLINTNLDDVSDWLTKIVVGVGLVQLREIPHMIYHYSALIAGKKSEQLAPLVSAVIVYFAILGFMTGYFTTRMFFERAFRIADIAAEGLSVRQITESETVKTATQTVSQGVQQT